MINQNGLQERSGELSQHSQQQSLLGAHGRQDTDTTSEEPKTKVPKPGEEKQEEDWSTKGYWSTTSTLAEKEVKLHELQSKEGKTHQGDIPSGSQSSQLQSQIDKEKVEQINNQEDDVSMVKRQEAAEGFPPRSSQGKEKEDETIPKSVAVGQFSQSLPNTQEPTSSHPGNLATNVTPQSVRKFQSIRTPEGTGTSAEPFAFEVPDLEVDTK